MEIHAEIFAIGNELCYGRVYDTNSFWIADQVTRLGAKVQRITCVPDSIADICTVVKEAVSRTPHFIILSGGLGPTPDDLTIEAVSKIFNLPVVTRVEILQLMAARRGVPLDQLPPNLVRMARSLEGAECLPNPLGWAPVTLIKNSDTTIITLPGPPAEMNACFNEYIAKRIRERTPYESISKRVAVTMAESRISPIIEEIMKNTPGTYLKPLVSEYQRDKNLLPVEVIVFAEDEEACRKKMKETQERLRELLVQNGGNLTPL